MPDPLREERRGATVVFASGKGGVGKSNVVANLAALFGRGGKKVLVVDGDLGLANIDVLLGVVPRLTVGHLLDGTHTLDEIVVEGPHGIRLVPASSGVEALTRLDEEQAGRLRAEIASAGAAADVTLIDAPAGIAASVTRLAAMADLTVIVTCPEPTALVDAYALIKVLYREDAGRRIGLLVNNVRDALEGQRVHRQLDRISKRFLDQGIASLGAIVRDDALLRAVQEQCPVIDLYPDSRISRAFETLSLRLAAEIGLAASRSRGHAGIPSGFIPSRAGAEALPEIIH